MSTENEKTSHLVVTEPSSPTKSSGAMYAGVPAIEACVLLDELAKHVVCSSARAMPKSATLAQWALSNTLCDFKSRCAMDLSCKYFMARATSSATRKTSCVFSTLFCTCISAWRLPWSIISSTIHILFGFRHAPNIRTTFGCRTVLKTATSLTNVFKSRAVMRDAAWSFFTATMRLFHRPA